VRLDHLLSKECFLVCSSAHVRCSRDTPSWCTGGAVGHDLEGRQGIRSLLSSESPPAYRLLFRFEGVGNNDFTTPLRRAGRQAEFRMRQTSHLENCRASTSISSTTTTSVDVVDKNMFSHGGCSRERLVHRAGGPRGCPPCETIVIRIPSYKEPTVDALAPRTDEGRE
jgi:hypothetical protein